MESNNSFLGRLGGPNVLKSLFFEVFLAVRDLGGTSTPVRTSGVLVIACAEDGEPFLILPVREQPFEKMERDRRLALEKAARLSRMAKERGHTTSWESRDPDNLQYGGAVLFEKGIIVSFSGLEEAHDEKLSLRVGEDIGLTPAKPKP